MSKSSNGKSLVLVVGAGASKEVNLPIGKELKTLIAEALNIRYDGYIKVSGDDCIDTAFRIIESKKDNDRLEISPYIHACQRIRNGMPLAISIDNFIDAHRTDGLIAICGKLAIVRSILAAEKNSSLCWNDPHTNIYYSPDFSTIESTWFNGFFQLLTENCHQDSLADRFEKVSIICFNYDRCIEHFLYSALQGYYGMSAEEASALLQCLKIYHPYGTVGKLPWQSNSTKAGIEFGMTPNPQKLVLLADELRTFTEGIDPNRSDILEIRATISNTERVAFIGFSFHRLNMDLLFQELSDGATKRSDFVWATAFGISGDDMDLISQDLSNLGGFSTSRITIRNNLKCADLFNEYRRRLSL